MTDYYLGIDGGGTKTQAVILDASGRLVGTGVSGSSNFGYIGVEQTIQNIGEAVTIAANDAGVSSESFASAFLGLAGVVSRADRDIVTGIGKTLKLAPDAFLGVDHDCRVALAGGLGGASGIVQIIGTGTSCFGMNANGERWMAGGWGSLIADEGGGYWMGVQAMKAATEAYDTRGKPTLLKQAVLDSLGISEIGQIMHRVYTQQISVAETAALGRLVIETAREGDQVALAIINAGMKEVARCVEAVANYLAFPQDSLRLTCVGGITQAGDIVMQSLTAAVHQRIPDCQIETPRFTPAIGAGLLAIQQHQGKLSSTVIKHLNASL